MRKEREEYLEIIKELDGDIPGKKAMLDYIKNSDCYCYGLPAPVSFVPAFYTEEDLKFCEDVVEMTHRILCKVIARYVEDPEYRKLFCFSEEVERLILLPCNYGQKLPIARFDIFLDENDLSYKFCEFNADGAAAMSRTQIGCEAVTQSESFRRFSARHAVRPFEHFDSWVKAFLEIYHTDKNAVESPSVCITDFTENVTKSDVTRYLAAFEKAGIDVRYVDIRNLVYEDGKLMDKEDGRVFHAVYRRAVTSDIARHMDECSALIRAVEEEKVCLIGHFRTTVVHAKMVNVALRDEQTKAFLTDEEWEFVLEHVLPTYRLRTDTRGLDIEAVKADKDAWIIKPEDDYDSHGVFAGRDASEEEWGKIVDSYVDRGYIAMEFYAPRTVDIVSPKLPVPGEKNFELQAWQTMPGLFQFNGKHIGFFSRMGREGVISESHNGVSVPSFRML